MDLIGTLKQTAKESPDRIAIRSSANEEGITYSELDEYTGRIAGACVTLVSESSGKNKGGH